MDDSFIEEDVPLKKITNQTPTMVKLGEPCRVLWGKHYGKKAWFNADKQESAEKLHIVVQEGPDTYIKTTAYKYMVRKGHIGATDGSLEEAAFDQIPELEQATRALATKLAKCDIKPSQKLAAMIHERLEMANDRQKRQGNKATWYKVDYNGKKRSHSSNNMED